MYDNFGVKELYEISFKTTNNIEINKQQYENDEVFMFFNDLMIGSVSAEDSVIAAQGGKYNFEQILWNPVKSLDFTFESGLVNMTGFNLNTQSKAFDLGATNVAIPKREFVTTNASGIATLSQIPTTTRSMFAYELLGDVIVTKLTIVGVSGKDVDLGIANATTPVVIDYYFLDDNVRYYSIGGENIQGFFKVTSKVKVVDVKDGQNKTMMFVLPKVKVLSNIGLTFGIKANPIVSSFKVRALPIDGALARFIYLNQDIEG